MDFRGIWCAARVARRRDDGMIPTVPRKPFTSNCPQRPHSRPACVAVLVSEMEVEMWTVEHTVARTMTARSVALRVLPCTVYVCTVPCMCEQLQPSGPLLTEQNELHSPTSIPSDTTSTHEESCQRSQTLPRSWGRAGLSTQSDSCHQSQFFHVTLLDACLFSTWSLLSHN